jgi:cytochrome c-type biogenesis protein CcmE
MANKDAAFGFRPIGKVGQNKDNQGLSEYNIAANSSAIYQNDTVQFLATGYVGVADTTTAVLLGSLNGVFYTDTADQKPRWANHLAASNAATDIVGFVSDDPYERFEVQSSTTLAIADIGKNADIVYAAGASPNFVSKVEVDTTTGNMTSATAQFRVVSVAKDIENSELSNATTYAANVNVVGIINEHFLKSTTGI